MRKLFFVLILLGLLLLVAAGVFIAYIYPNYVKPGQEYGSAVALYEAGDYVPAALQFESMSGRDDSAQLAKKAWLAAGDQSFEQGDLAQARTYYLKGGADSSVLAKVDSMYYQLGVKAYAENERVEAENCFSCISEGSSYLNLLDQVRISCGERFLADGDFDSAGKVFHLCGEASYDEISGLWLGAGENRLRDFDIDDASFCFAKAMAFSSDEVSLVKTIDELWNNAGIYARQTGNAELAAKCFARTSTGAEQGMSALMTAYDSAVNAYNECRFTDALRLFTEAGEYSDAASQAASLRASMDDYFNAGGVGFYAVLEPDGTVGLGGDWGAYSAPVWTGIKQVAVGFNRFMLGLTESGTVLFHGNGSFGNSAVSGWQGVKQIACGEEHSVALLEDGRVLACGPDTYGEVSGVNGWSSVKQIAAGKGFTAVLMQDGTVAACGDNANGQCAVSGIGGAAAVACGERHLVILKNDGTVLAMGDNTYGQCSTSDWNSIIAVFAGANHTVGLRVDGSLVACGSNSNGECELEGIENVLCVSCGDGSTYILLNNGQQIIKGN